MCMYRNYLLSKEFWASNGQKRDGKPINYMKHDSEIGGIYATLVHRGVKITVNNESRFFNNFDRLEEFLESLYLRSRNIQETEDSFHKILNRREKSNYFRKLNL